MKRLTAAVAHSYQYHGEALRFFLISLAGLGVDIATAWGLIVVVGMMDVIAATIGFAVATVGNYFGHQFWTFRHGEQWASLGRFVRFVAVILLTLATRLVVLSALVAVLPGGELIVLIRLGLAALLSFVVSFVCSRRLVFQVKGAPSNR